MNINKFLLWHSVHICLSSLLFMAAFLLQWLCSAVVMWMHGQHILQYWPSGPSHRKFLDLCLRASPYLGIHLLVFLTGRAVAHLMNTTVLTPKERNAPSLFQPCYWVDRLRSYLGIRGEDQKEGGVCSGSSCLELSLECEMVPTVGLILTLEN